MYLLFLLQVIALVSCKRKITINNQNSGAVFYMVVKKIPSFSYDTSNAVSVGLYFRHVKHREKGAFLTLYGWHMQLFKAELFRGEKEK